MSLRFDVHLVQDVAHTGEEAAYEPFSVMLQYALEPLLLLSGGADSAPHSLSVIAKILRTVKRVSDATPDPKTSNMCACGTASSP